MGRGKKTGKRPSRETRPPTRYHDTDAPAEQLPSAKKPKRSLSVGLAGLDADSSESDSEHDLNSNQTDAGVSVGHGQHQNTLTPSLEEQVKQMVGTAVSAALPEVIRQVMSATANISSGAGKQSATSATATSSTSEQSAASSAATSNQSAATATSSNHSAVDAAVQEQTETLTAGKISLPSLPLDLHLTSDMKAKIVGNKYVKFGQLLFKDASDNDKLTVQVTNKAIEGQQLTVNPHPQQVRIKDISAWDRAFDIYCFTYFSQHSNQAQGVTQYGRLIKDMAWRGYQWLNYDTSFRRLREMDADSYPWSKIEPHLWSQCAVPQTNVRHGLSQNIASNQSRPGFQSPTFPARGRGRNFRDFGRGGRANNFRSTYANQGNRSSTAKCFRFNKGQHCNGSCAYDHSCSNCGGNHPGNNCRRN